MTTGAELIKQFLEGIRQDAIQDLSAKGISDGDLGMTVNVIERDSPEGTLTGNEYWYYLVHGRKPGKQPPIESIEGWIQKKGIRPTDISERSLAFLIARKIGQLGTDIYQGKRPGLALPQIIETRNQGLQEDIDKHVTDLVDKTIVDGLNSIFGQPN